VGGVELNMNGGFRMEVADAPPARTPRIYLLPLQI